MLRSRNDVVALALLPVGQNGLEVIVGQSGIKDGVPVILEIGWFQSAWGRMPTVQEQDFHGRIVAGGMRS